MQFRWLGAVGLAATALWTLVGLPGRMPATPARPRKASTQLSRVPAPPPFSPSSGASSADPHASVASNSHLASDLTKILATDKNPSLARPAVSNWLFNSVDSAVAQEHASWGTQLLDDSTSDAELPGFGQLTDVAALPLEGTRPRDLSHTDPAEQPPAYDPHAELFAKQRHPSARDCAACHQQIFDEWSVSGHAYAAISPMYHRLADTLTSCTSGPLNAACNRCHAPATANSNEQRPDPSILTQPSVALEGVTCVACHRPLTAGDEPKIAIAPPPPGAAIIATAAHSDPPLQFPIQFETVAESEFCVSCHQVAVYPDVTIPLMWNQYCASPAAKEGTTCQDCHMGQVPGVANGYATAPVAVIEGRPVDVGRKHSNHIFFGPSYSIAHPGVFPIGSAPSRWTTEQWLQFDWRAGWGSEPFEQQIASMPAPPAFPSGWTTADERRAGYQLVLQNLNLLNQQRTLRRQLLESTSQVRGPLFSSTPTPSRPLSFEYVVSNLNAGHSFPAGSLDARPLLWLNVVLTGPNGEHLWESGYLDNQGNLADEHSEDVANGRLARDDELTQFRTRFVTTADDGSDHEMLLPLPPNWLSHLATPTGSSLSAPFSLSRPLLIRPEPQSIPPLGNVNARFRIPASALSQPGRYRLSARMRHQSSAIHYMNMCRATPEMTRNMLEGSLDFHQQSFEFDVK